MSGHRRSLRLETFDYSQAGAYVVTICTYSRMPLFGRIVDGTMSLSPAGQIAEREWERTPSLRPTVNLDVFVVMPNHVHGIILITTDSNPTNETRQHVRGLHSPSQNLGAIVRGFKAATTRQMAEIGIHQPIWQRNYYEHVIRSDGDLDRIREYIVNNPLQWSLDRYFQG